MAPPPPLSLRRYRRTTAPDVRRTNVFSAVEHLLARLPMLAWATDPDLHLTWIDGGAAQALGLDHRSAIGGPVSRIFDCENQAFVERHREAVAGRTQAFELGVLDRWYDLRIDPLCDRIGGIVGSVGMARDITKEKRAERSVLWHTSNDPVTGVLSRRRLCENLESLLRRSESAKRELAVLYIDVDDFGSINDSIGSEEADLVLRQIAGRISASCAEASVARAGADEFAIVIPSARTEEVEQICRDLHAQLCEPFATAGRSLHLSVSLGTAVFPRDGESVERLLDNAAAATRHAFEMGGNQSRIYSPALTARTSERLQMERDLRNALDRNEFFLMYQPQVRLSDGSISGIETLLRWRKDGDVVPAWSFIRRVEESPLMIPIGEWVFDNAMKQLAAWKEQGLHPGRLAVNLGARQLSDPSVVTSIRNTLARHEVGAESVDIEITETSAMQNLETTTKLIGELRAMGVSITVDDFGTGYSSLSYLQRFPITGLKIDRSFTADLPHSATAVAIVDAIISTARALGVRLVAEGVETEEQAAHLRAAGCSDAQGFLYARPLTAQAMTLYLATSKQRTKPRTTRKKHA